MIKLETLSEEINCLIYEFGFPIMPKLYKKDRINIWGRDNNKENLTIRYRFRLLWDFIYKKLISFAGIGNPSNFFDLLKDNRLNVVKEIEFPDHKNYSEKELEKLVELEKKYNAKLITTEKDYLRIKSLHRRRIDFIPIKVKIDKQDELIEIIKKILKWKYLNI